MLFLALSLALSAAPPKLVSVPWSVTRVDPALADIYEDGLARALRSHGIAVTTAKELTTLLGVERQRQLLGCGEGSSCLVELANAVGCDSTLMVSLSRLDTVMTASVKVLSSSAGRVLAETVIEATSERAFADRLDDAALTIAHLLVPPPPKRPLRAGVWVPLLVGGVLTAGGAVSVGGAYLEAGAIDRQLAADGVVIQKSRDDAAWGRILQAGGWSLVGVGLAALLTGLVVSFFPEAPLAPTVSFSAGHVELGFALVLP